MVFNGIYRKTRSVGHLTETYTVYLETSAGQLHYVMEDKSGVVTQVKEMLILGQAKQIIKDLDLQRVMSEVKSP